MQSVVLAFLGLLCAVVPTQDRESATRAEYHQRARTLRIESGARHLELGIEMRNRGLVAQAAAEIVLAVEVSERLHPGANTVLALMRRFDESFWKRRIEPTPARLDQYEEKAARVRRKNREGRFELGEWARRKGLADFAREEFLGLMREADEPIELDAKGRIVLDVGVVHADVSTVVRESAITINGRLYLRDAFLEHLPDVDEIHEHSSERLRVRCLTNLEDALEIHALGEALLPHLEAGLGGRPGRRMQVFLFAERAVYETYLDAARLSAYRAVSGFADQRSLTTVICTDGRELGEVHGLVLHELAHLAEHVVTPARMPAWFREGLAESFGGRGTFTWDGERLVTGLALDRALLAPLHDPKLRFTVAELFALDPLTLWTHDRDAAQRFYAQSWGLYQFLRNHAAADVRARFDDWLAMSRGTAASAEDVRLLFDRAFATDLPAVEAAFTAWLTAL